MTQDNPIQRQIGQDRYGIPIARGSVIMTDERGVDSVTLLVTEVRGNAIIGAVISSANWDGPLTSEGVDFDTAWASASRVIFQDFREIVAAMDYKNGPAPADDHQAAGDSPGDTSAGNALRLLALIEQLAGIEAQIGPLVYELAPKPDSDCDANGEEASAHIDKAMYALAKIFPSAAIVRACQKHCTPAASA